VAVTEVGVHQAKTGFSKLLRRVMLGEEIVITRGGEPVAKLVPIASFEARTFGSDAGRLVVPEDFNAPLPEDVMADFEK
jgi:prevent-host-death family protein